MMVSAQHYICSLSYASVDNTADIILKLGRNTQLAKMDIKSAYRIMLVHPKDRRLLGMMWMEIDTVLPFGLRSKHPLAIYTTLVCCTY